MGKFIDSCEGMSCDEIQFEVQQYTRAFQNGKITGVEYNERTKPLVDQYRSIMCPTNVTQPLDLPEEPCSDCDEDSGLDTIIMGMLRD